MTDDELNNISFPVTFRDGVRYRPTMALGGVDSRAVNLLIFEVIAGTLARNFKEIDIAVLSDVTIKFTCRGWTPSGQPGAALTPADLIGLCDGTTRRSFMIKDGNYLPVLSALSSTFEIGLRVEGSTLGQRFLEGLPVTGSEMPAIEGEGECCISATLDRSIFKTASLKNDALGTEIKALKARFPEVGIALMADGG